MTETDDSLSIPSKGCNTVAKDIYITVSRILILGITVYFILYLIAVIHELGHYIPRKLWGIQTKVEIAKRFSLRIGDWMFGFSLLPSGQNYPVRCLTQGPSRRNRFIVLGGPAFNIATSLPGWPHFCYAVDHLTFIWHVSSSSILLLWSIVFPVGSLVNGIVNLFPFSKVQGKKQHLRSPHALIRELRAGHIPQIISDGMWCQIITLLRRNPALQKEFDELLQTYRYY
jgi:hypothetical protein